MQIRQWYYGKHEITQNGRMGIRLPYKQIEHVYYTSDMLVRKVTGYIIICRKSLNNGISKNTPRRKRVRWDGYGRCYNINNNTRLRDHDIHF